MRIHILRLFTSSVTLLCFFFYCIESDIVCPKPQLPKNSWSFSEEEFYGVNSTFVYECRRRYYLFGNKTRICLPNGQWSGTTPYCSGESDKVKLKEGVPEFAKLMDGRRTSCLPVTYKNLFKHNSIYLEIYGIQSLVVVLIVPDSPYRRGYNVSYRNYFPGNPNATDTGYVKCPKESFSNTYRCDFRKPIKTPVIRIDVGKDLRQCNSCKICEVIVYTDQRENMPCLPPNTKHAIWNPSNYSYAVGTAILLDCEVGYELSSNSESITCEHASQRSTLICMAKRLRRCNPPETEYAYWNKSYNNSDPIGMTLLQECEEAYEFSNNSTTLICHEDGQWSPLNCSEILVSLPAKESNMALIYALPAVLLVVVSFAVIIAVLVKKRKNKKSGSAKQTDYRERQEDQRDLNEERYCNYPASVECVYYNDKELESGKPADNPREIEDHYDQVNENRYIVPSQLKNPKSLEPQSIYLNESFSLSDSTRPLSEEAGYLVPIMIPQSSFKGKGIENRDLESPDTNIYCSIPECSPKQSANATNLYANM